MTESQERIEHLEGILKDLEDRAKRAKKVLEGMAQKTSDTLEAYRLLNKAKGVDIVISYMRDYKWD